MHPPPTSIFVCNRQQARSSAQTSEDGVFVRLPPTSQSDLAGTYLPLEHNDLEKEKETRGAMRSKFFLLCFLALACSFVSAADCSENDKTCVANDKMKVGDLLAKETKEVSSFLGGIYEHSEWVSQALVKEKDLKSITTVSGLASAIRTIVDQASESQKIKLLQAHPDLAAKVEQLPELTADSQAEQASAGLQSMTKEEREKFSSLNARYKKQFGIPFVLAVRHSTKYTVLSALEGRVDNSKEKEIVIALEQVHKIAWMRLMAKVESDEPAGFLTCHVLDTANGIPAAKMRISLTRLSPPESAGLVANFVTNDDGRLEGGPALKGSNFTVGTYEWIFYTGDYFASKGTFVSGTPFLDEVPLRFGIDNPDDHYHVPLLVSPWSYSTYRGS